MCIRDVLQRQGVWCQWILHRPVAGATRFAGSLHEPGRRVAKGVLVRAGEGGHVLAVLPATARIDLARFSQVLGGVAVDLATEDEVERVFHDCERGALPPFGRCYGLETVVDASLGASAEIVCVGNRRHEAVRLRHEDFLAIETPRIADFAVAPEEVASEPGRRRAG